MIRAVDQRRSTYRYRPATPNEKIAPITRAVSGVNAHGQTVMADSGARNRNALVNAAATPTSPATTADPVGNSTSSAVGATSWRRLVAHTANTSTGVVKYR